MTAPDALAPALGGGEPDPWDPGDCAECSRPILRDETGGRHWRTDGAGRNMHAWCAADREITHLVVALEGAFTYRVGVALDTGELEVRAYFASLGPIVGRGATQEDARDDLVRRIRAGEYLSTERPRR